MDILFTYKNVKHSDALEEYAIKRLHKVEKYVKETTEISVTFEIKGKENICTVSINERHYVKSKKSTESMYDACDLCVQSLKNTLSKDKDKCKSKWKRAKGLKSEIDADLLSDEEPEFEYYDNLD